jgi:hypothetical protein
MARNVTTRPLSGGFWQVECLEEVQLLRCRFAYSVETAASSVCRVFLDALQDVEGALGTHGVPLGFQSHAHDAVKGELLILRCASSCSAGACGASFAYRNCRVLNEIIQNLAGGGQKKYSIITQNQWDGGCSGRTKSQVYMKNFFWVTERLYFLQIFFFS